MVRRFLMPAFVVVVAVLVVTPLCYGQRFDMPRDAVGSNNAWYDPGSTGFWMALGVRKYINSFSSYQFPAPGTTLDPISRLEWPWEQVFGLAKVGWAFRTFELKLEYASTALLPSGLKAQDSDWEDEGNPNQKTTFSQAKAKPKGWTFDASTSVPCPSLEPLRGIVGFRKQQFKFTYTDILQSGIWQDGSGYGPVVRDFTAGPAIEFSQYFTHWYLGGVYQRVFDPGQYWSDSMFPCIVARLQADYAYVTGSNHDQHLLREILYGGTYYPSDRHTYENTTGTGWHVNALVGFYGGSDRRFRLDIEADFTRIKTRGSHQYTEWATVPVVGPYGTSESWSGAKVWSDQAWVGISGTYFFSGGTWF